MKRALCLAGLLFVSSTAQASGVIWETFCRVVPPPASEITSSSYAPIIPMFEFARTKCSALSKKEEPIPARTPPRTEPVKKPADTSTR